MHTPNTQTNVVSLWEGEQVLPEENEGSSGADRDIVFYDTKDVARILQCSVATARDIMHRKDFPLIVAGKNFRVSKSALEQWAMTRRD